MTHTDPPRSSTGPGAECDIYNCLPAVVTVVDYEVFMTADNWFYWAHLQPSGLNCWINTHTHICLTALFPGLPWWSGTRKVQPICILLKQETRSGSGISWAVCKSAPCCRQITMLAPHHWVFYRPGALPAAQPTASKHWRQMLNILYDNSDIDKEKSEWNRMTELLIKLNTR